MFSRRGTRMRRALRVGAVIVILVLVAGIAVRYLSSRLVAGKVANQLEVLYGGPVKVAAVDIGLKGTSLGDFELFEPVGNASPWLTVENLRTDISLFDILGGHALPRRLDVTGARVLLRFDREGKLLTSLPEQLFHGTKHPVSVESIPDVELHESQITFRKEGSSD